jgi:chromosomal replication initiator protein
MSQLWTETLAALEPRFGAQTFEMWVRPLRPIRFDDGRSELVLGAPNRFLKEWFETHYLDTVREEFNRRAHTPWTIALEILESAPTPRAEPSNRPTRPAPRVTELPSLHARYRFEHFVTGTSNELAASAAMAVAEDPGVRYNPLFIYGDVGLGKTHLLHAVGHAIHERDPSLRIAYLSAEHFMNEFVTAVRRSQFDEFRARYRNQCDCLLVDDIQLIAGRDRTMEEFFHVFNALHEAGKQIVVTADRVPSDMVGMEDRLISRLNWGLVADVQAPDLETRIAILERKAEREGISVVRSACEVLAEAVQSNVRELEGALLRVAAFADLKGRSVDAALVRETLGERRVEPKPPVTVEAVQKVVASYFRVRISDLKGRRRHRAIARPRMIAMFLSRELTGASYPEIGMRFGGKDHSTVINACRRITAISLEDPDTAAAVSALRQRLARA